MAVGEGATLHVLPCDADVVAFNQQGTKCQGLGRSPVDAFSLLRHLSAGLEDLLHLTMELELFWHASRLDSDVTQDVNVNAGGAETRVLRRSLETFPLGGEPVALLWLGRFAGLKVLLVRIQHELTDFVGFVLGHHAFIDQALFEEIEGGWVARNLLVQLWLGEGRLVQLVVTVSAVAHHVNQHIASEFVSPFHRGFQGRRHGERVISVAVEDWAVECLAQVAAVRRGTRMDRVGGETNLVIYDHVDCATNVKVWDVGELHRFVDNALAGKGCISVQQDGDDVTRVFGFVAAIVLPSTGLSSNNRIDTFQMRRIRDKRKMDATTIGIGTVHAGTKMVLDITRDSPTVVGFDVLVGSVMGALEFAKDQRHWLAHHVGKDVETTAMRHADDEGMGTQFAGAVDGVLEGRHDGFATIQTETLGGVELVGQKALEGVGKAQTFVDVRLLFLVVRQPLWIFDAFADPIHLDGITDVHVLDAKSPAVRFAQLVQDDTQRDLAGGRGQFFEVPLVSAR
mmetsp:Transcript_9479/g.27032  ORF Transcript_9479/g.27032 Transcript_9479/m.27032 type:complete len:511 (-) Transcript_9479:689-2221(-)